MEPGLVGRVRRWIEGDPDAGDRAELEALLAAGDAEELADRFSGRLVFGTAGLRGRLGAGPRRMNTAVVRQTTAGLADWLVEQVPDARARGVVVGYDGRRRSDAFAAEVAGVLLARGFEVHLWDRCTPTPTTPWLLRERGAAAGVQVTASHNPPADNGYKVYWEDGAQIIPPHDEGIAARIAAAAEGPAVGIPRLPPEDAPPGQLHVVGEPELAAYRARVLADTPSLPPGERTLRIVYTALHGVGQDTLLAVLRAAGFESVFPVGEQGEPDGEFPTVAFPNPEEPGALDLALARAREVDADLIIANDPDADRLAVVVRDGEHWRQLTGNEVGALLGEQCVARTSEPRPLLVASIVSSELCGRIAEAHGAAFAQVLTGFKWIMAEARRSEAEPDGHRFVYGFEEALGYCVGRAVRDKDGISGALALVCLAQQRASEGRTLVDQLGALYARHGAWLTGQAVRRFSGSDAGERMAEVMRQVRAAPPGAVGDLALWRADDHLAGTRREGGSTGPLDGPEADLLCLRYGAPGADSGLRVLIRPSGTEPKVKVYFEWRDPDGEAAGRRRLDALMAAWETVDPSVC